MFQYDGLVVGQRIRNLRVEAGYELGEFSDELGKSESHIKQVELGSRTHICTAMNKTGTERRGK